MTRFRVVLDCNVVISALLYRGRLSVLPDRWKTGAFAFLACKEMVQEWVRVLAYPRFQLDGDDIHYLIEKEILPYIEPVQITFVPDVIQEDPPDNVYLACAEGGKADYLVSGDAHLLKLKSYRNIPVITGANFLKLIA